jgi:hypothetical protein
MPFTRLERIPNQMRRCVFILVDPIAFGFFSLCAAAWVLVGGLLPLGKKIVLHLLPLDWRVLGMREMSSHETDRLF